MKTAIIGLLTVYYASVAQAYKCCVPNKWHGYQYGKGDFFKAISIEAEQIYYDADNNRTALSGVFVRDGVRTEVQLIDDYGESKRYVIDPSNQQCRTESISRGFPKLCVPDSGKEIVMSYMGFGENVLSVKGYIFVLNQGVFNMNVFMLVTETEDGCIPISLDVRGKYNSTNYYEILNFVNMTVGITDTTIFNPPAYCNKAIPGETNGEVILNF